MASASLPEAKSFTPPLHQTKEQARWHSGILFLLMLALLLLVTGHSWAHLPAEATAILSMAIACFLWCLHLKAVILRGFWIYPLALMLAMQLVLPIFFTATLPPSDWLGALGCGLFVYAMLWFSAKHESEPGLQPLATIALLLSIGIMTKPAVAISCALLSTLFFFRSRGKFGGFINSTLLLITPTVLCSFAFLALYFLTTRTIHSAVSEAMSGYQLQSAGKIDLPLLIQESQSLFFALAVLLSRLLERKTGILDLSYFILIAFLSTAGMAHWMPNALSQVDIQLTVYAGAACLLTLTPPRKASHITLIFVGMSLPFLKYISF